VHFPQQIAKDLLESKKLAKYYESRVKKLNNVLEMKANNKYVIAQALLKLPDNFFKRDSCCRQDLDF
jgi:hypothetical protein